MNIVTMKQHRDCLVAALATVLQTTWERAAEMIGHRDLKCPLTSLLYSTHWKLRKTLDDHGIDYQEVKSMHEWVPGKTIVLIHKPGNFISRMLAKHWVVYLGKDASGNTVYLAWGNHDSAVTRTAFDMLEMFTGSWPTCAFVLK